MTNYPKVSVITITYGHELYIKETLDGIFMQKYDGEIEVIIANDNSPDATHEIITVFLSETDFPENFKINYFKHDINKGVFPNFIWALEQAASKYVAICEGDDYWTEPNKLQKQVDLLEKNTDCSMCVALYSQLNSTGLSKECRNEGENGLKINFPFAAERYFHTTTFLIRGTALKNIIDKHKELIIGDTALRYLLSAEGPFILLNDYVSVYRQTGTGIWTSLKEYEKAHAHYKIFSKFRKKHIKSRKYYYLQHEIFHLRSALRLQQKKYNVDRIRYYYLLFLEDKTKNYHSMGLAKERIKQIVQNKIKKVINWQK